MSQHGPLVVIDPGHGGDRTVGGSSPNNATGLGRLLEKTLTLDLARRIARLVEPAARVVLTRQSDAQNPSLAQRAATAREQGAAVFVSLHFNAWTDPAVDGATAFVARAASPRSRDLAETLLQRLDLAGELPNLGVQQRDLGVLLPDRHAPDTAACLVEVAYLSNMARAGRLEDDAYLGTLAQALADGIRRQVGLLGAVDAGANGNGSARSASLAPSSAMELTEEERIDAEMPQERWEARAASIIPRVRALQVPALGRADARFADDAFSPDYRHLDASGAGGTFQLTPQDLDVLCGLNRFDVSGGQDQVLFGLRGCRLADAAQEGQWRATVGLEEAIPDHHEARCVLGVWRRSAGQLAVFTSSTVPNWRLMEQQRQQWGGNAAPAGGVANLLPTGCYTYVVGAHRDIPGAFQQSGEVVVLRTRDDLIYEVTDYWQRGRVGDNIHAARLDLRGNGTPRFSSAGCQTVPGNYEGGQHLRAWGRFREAAGLSAGTPASENGRRYRYVLLTGRDVRLLQQATSLDAAELTRLRFGSSGADVVALQGGLVQAGYLRADQVDGDLGPTTAAAYVQWQQARDGGRADCVVRPDDARALGADIVGHRSLQQSLSRRQGATRLTRAQQYLDPSWDEDRKLVWTQEQMAARTYFPDEPATNADGLPIPPWFDPDGFLDHLRTEYAAQDAAVTADQRRGGNSRSAAAIIGDPAQAVPARYFVVHDTAGYRDMLAANLRPHQRGVHLWIGAVNLLLARDWHLGGDATALENRNNTHFVHVELTRHRPGADGLAQQAGTLFTDRQYDDLANAYVVACIRRGTLLTVTVHREVDRGIDGAHNDPEDFDMERFYRIVAEKLAMPAGTSFGIAPARAALANGASHANAFWELWSGASPAANQYGAVRRNVTGAAAPWDARARGHSVSLDDPEPPTVRVGAEGWEERARQLIAARAAVRLAIDGDTARQLRDAIVRLGGRRLQQILPGRSSALALPAVVIIAIVVAAAFVIGAFVLAAVAVAAMERGYDANLSLGTSSEGAGQEYGLVIDLTPPAPDSD